jgi:hypothetical protein
MAMTEAERFREEAEECLRQAERAVSPLDQLTWLRMAQEWTKLAIDALQRRQPCPTSPTLPTTPTTPSPSSRRPPKSAQSPTDWWTVTEHDWKYFKKFQKL